MVNYFEISNRIKYLTGKKRDKEIAELFSISPADYLNRKKRGTLLPLIVEWAIHESVNLHWLLTGESPMRREEAQEIHSIQEMRAGYAAEDARIVDLLRMAREVMLSDTIYAEALQSNLVAFHRAVTREKIVSVAVDASVDERLKLLEKALRVIEGKGDPPGERSSDASRKESVAANETPEGPIGKLGM